MNNKVALPRKENLVKFNNKDLQKLSELVYSPLLGVLYRKRFSMMKQFLSGRYERILEVGCGQGFLIPELARHCNFVYGVDLQNELKKTESIIKKEGINNFYLINANIYHIPFKKNTFELIVCLSTLEHLRELDSVIKEIAYILKDRGIIILGFPIKNKVTKKLYGFLGYNDEEIHPSGHGEIFKSCKNFLVLEESLWYPRFFSLDKAVYFVGKFRKN